MTQLLLSSSFLGDAPLLDLNLVSEEPPLLLAIRNQILRLPVALRRLNVPLADRAVQYLRAFSRIRPQTMSIFFGDPLQTLRLTLGPVIDNVDLVLDHNPGLILLRLVILRVSSLLLLLSPLRVNRLSALDRARFLEHGLQLSHGHLLNHLL